jgi:hypothetical protein
LSGSAIVLPWLMRICLRNSEIRREIEPFIGFGSSLLCGTGLLVLAVWVTARMQLSQIEAHAVLKTRCFLQGIVWL